MHDTTYCMHIFQIKSYSYYTHTHSTISTLSDTCNMHITATTNNSTTMSTSTITTTSHYASMYNILYVSLADSALSGMLVCNN